MKRRSIISAQRSQQKKERRNQVILGFAVIILMVTSVLGVALYNTNPQSQSAYTDMGQEFEIIQLGQQQLLQTQQNGKTLEFYFPPSSTMDIVSDFNPLFTQTPILGLAFDPTQEPLEYVDLARYTVAIDAEKDGIGVQTLMTNQSELFDFPVVDCINTDIPVIIFTYDNNTRITQQENCLFVYGNGPEELLRATDRLRYQMQGIVV